MRKGKGPRRRAGWLTTKMVGEPVAFAIDGGQLVCLVCGRFLPNRERFIAHSCEKRKAKPVKKTE